MSDNADLFLFDYPGSPCARRVRIMMVEKGIDWHNITIDLMRMEPVRSRVTAVPRDINPFGDS